jgi:hypothetical protein
VVIYNGIEYILTADGNDASYWELMGNSNAYAIKATTLEGYNI